MVQITTCNQKAPGKKTCVGLSCLSSQCAFYFKFKWPTTKSAKYEPLFYYGVVSCNRHSPTPYGWMFLKKLRNEYMKMKISE